MLDILKDCVIIMELIVRDAVIAQSVERVIGNDEVGSSNLPNSSKKSTVDAVLFFFALMGTVMQKKGNRIDQPGRYLPGWSILRSLQT